MVEIDHRCPVRNAHWKSVGLAIAAVRHEIEKIWSLERKDQKESCIRPYAKRAAEPD